MDKKRSQIRNTTGIYSSVCIYTFTCGKKISQHYVPIQACNFNKFYKCEKFYQFIKFEFKVRVLLISALEHCFRNP